MLLSLLGPVQIDVPHGRVADDGYTLTATKPKMKKADPESRTYCHNQAASPGSPPGTRTPTWWPPVATSMTVTSVIAIGPDLIAEAGIAGV